SDDDGKDIASLFLGGGIKFLAERHDIDTARPESGTDGWRRVGLAGRDLQFDMSDYFLCHKLVVILSGAKRSRRIPLKLPSRFRRGMSRLCSTSPLGLASFHLPIFQFDGRSATKDGDGNPQLAPFRVNFFNNTVLVLE